MTTSALSRASVQLDRARREIARATAAVRHAHLEALPLSALRARETALGAALDTAVAAATAAGPEHAAELEQLRTRRELHALAALSTPGIHLPTCPRASSRSALAPLIAGMSLDPTPALGPPHTRTYGLDMTACVDRDSAADILDHAALSDATALPAQRPSKQGMVSVAS